MGAADAMAIKWRELVSPWSPQQPFLWTAEHLRRLDGYVQRAQEYLESGEVEQAVAAWEEALASLPEIPAPRRQALCRRLEEGLHTLARAALRSTPPDLARAIDYLERAARWDGNSETCQVLGLLHHLRGDLSTAREWYRRAEAEASPTWELVYGQALALLQDLFSPRSSRSDAGPAAAVLSRLGDLGLDYRRLLPHTSREDPSGGGSPAQDDFAAAAWQRLGAMTALVCQAPAQAFQRFPATSGEGLPREWALEGALLAALQGAWDQCLAYYRVALSHTPSFPHQLHSYVLLTALAEAADASFPIPVTALPPSDPPRDWFIHEEHYAPWRRRVLRWRYRQELARARAALTRGDEAELRRALEAALGWRPDAPRSRLLALWMACAYGGRHEDGDHQARDGLAATEWPEEKSRALQRLAVWVAERFGTDEDVISRLNRLLNDHPQDPWGLRRWKSWMWRLGQEALAQEKHEQALLQFVSLLMYLPDDADGWLGCSQALSAMGDQKRASHCAAEARRLRQQMAARPEAVAHRAPVSTVEYELLGDLLAEPFPEEEESSLPSSFRESSCPFHPALVQGVLQESFRAPDIYLQFLVERWAASPNNSFTDG